MLYKLKHILNKTYFNISIIIASLIFSCVSFTAQDSILKKNKTILLEGQVYPNYNVDIYQPQFKLRLKLNDNSALRLNTNFSRTSSYIEILEDGGDGLGSVEKINSLFGFSFGYEYHKTANSSVVYAGFEGLVGFGREDEYGSRTDSINFIPDRNYNIKSPIQQLGFRIFTGVDFLITKNLYLGTEFGLLFLKTDYKVGSETIENVSSITDPVETKVIPKRSVTNLSYSGLGVIRVGWRF